MHKEMEKILKQLRLWNLLERWDDVIAEARKKRFSPERLLTYVLENENRKPSRCLPTLSNGPHLRAACT